jgi:putative tryptophan/tyrosine transport system substrate-binding protein
MTRRLIVLLIALALNLLVAPLAAEAQPATPVSRIGLLRSGHPPAGPDPNLEAFRQALRELGYAEGQNLVLASRYAEGSEERLPELAAELVRLPVGVLVAPGTAAIRAAQQATRTIPIVMAGSYDPVGEGFIASLARPGGAHHGLELPAGRAPAEAAGVAERGSASQHTDRRLVESARARLCIPAAAAALVYPRIVSTDLDV